jgi:hypothetical protein
LSIPDFYKQKTQRFGNWICFRLQARGGGTYSTEKNQKLAYPQAMPEQKKETDPVSETLCFLFVEIRNGQSPEA